MLSKTAKSLSVVKPGDNVKVPSIPKQDRGNPGQKLIIGVVTSTSGNYYSIGTSQGISDRRYRRGEFEHWEGSSTCVSEIPKTEIKMHTAAKLVSYGVTLRVNVEEIALPNTVHVDYVDFTAIQAVIPK